MSTPAELAAQAQLEHDVDWGTYLAVGPIDIDGARAFNTGHAVPKSHVDRGLVDAAQVSKAPNPPKVTKAAVAEAAAALPTAALPNVTGA